MRFACGGAGGGEGKVNADTMERRKGQEEERGEKEQAEETQMEEKREQEERLDQARREKRGTCTL